MSPCSCSYHYKLLSLMVWPVPPALCFCSYPSHWLSLAFLNQRPCGTLLAQTKDAGSSRKLGSWAAVDTAGASKPFQQCPALFLLSVYFSGGSAYIFSATRNHRNVYPLLAGVGLWKPFRQAQQVSTPLLPTTQHSQSTRRHPHPHF